MKRLLNFFRYYIKCLSMPALICTLFFSCNIKSDQRHYVIAFSQCTTGNWRNIMMEEMKRELSFHPNITFISEQADGSTQRQIQQVKNLLKQHIDLLIISPNEAEPLRPIVEQAFNTGLPVIVVDRKISSPLYTAYVGGDNYEVGNMAGEYAVNLLNKKGKVLEFTLLPGSSPAIERTRGFADAIEGFSEVKLVAAVNGDVLKDSANPKLVDIIKANPDVDLVYAHNDFLALRLVELYKRIGLPMPKLIGVDGLPGRGEGLDMVSNKQETATLLYPTGGEEAIRTAVKILNKEDFNHENNLRTTVIDSTNVRYMQMQANKMKSLQEAIERQQEGLVNLKTIYYNLRTFTYILVASLLISLVLSGLVFYALRENRKINQKLKLQNLEISDQKDQLEIMSAKARVANEAKVNFFTNISHEFRTPLTLILAPLEELSAGVKTNFNQNRNLNLIHKNVIRLLRLVNQLMDFRKIEVDKMRLKASENDLIFFVSEIIQSYQSIASQRKIDLRLITNERQLMVWFDVNMLDKVIFNLLSNTFKFTKDNGYVHVYVNKDETGKNVIIKVEDDGIGMSEDAVKNAFELFYQGEFENQKGSGLGLALSKELIKLHKGEISVRSEKWKGTSFVISLPLGNAHLEKIDLTDTATIPYILYEDEKVYTTDLKNEQNGSTEMEGLTKQREYSILLIEDNKDLRDFLKNRLQNEYEILEADNSQSGLQQAFDTVPDLIISDIVIPGKDGIKLVHIFKTDIRTSHIPIILLSGQTNIEQQIAGMKNMADVYITKPFNVQFLEQTIKSLIANRSKLKDHFTSELPSSLKSQTVGKIDRKFVSEFTAIIESNLANEQFTAEDISKIMGISRVQLYRKVKALLNINVNDYILNVRLQKAKYLLQHEESTISEIAYAVGFSSPAYFSTVFKSKFGVTPKAFREK